MSTKLRNLQAQKADKIEAARAITNAAVDRDLSAEEQTRVDALLTEIGALDASIGREKALADAESSVEIDGYVISTIDNTADAPTRGFASFGEFARATVAAAFNPLSVDRRLTIGAASTIPSAYGNEGTGADGGFLVPPAFSDQIVQTAYNQNDSFVPMTDNTPVDGNGMTFNVDETTPWGTNGIKAYWTDEAGASTESKAKFDPAQLRLKKLTAMVPITEEMLADTSALSRYVSGKVPEAIAFKTNEALWSGSGAGKPKGFYSSSALLVTVAKETGQTADTVTATNISKMRARMSARSWRRAIWTVNADVLPQLDALAYGTAASNAHIYSPQGGRFGYGTLLGRDVMVTDFNETIGDVGDVVLVDWGMYRTITKAGGAETSTSMHFWFDRGLTAFRTIFRIDGQPSIAAPVTPNKGSNTLSPIVALAARA